MKRPGSGYALPSFLALVLGLLVGAVFMTLSGANPLTGYFYILQGGLMSIRRIGDTLATASPLILAGLSVAFAFRTGLFNIGASGQMLFGGFSALACALTLDLPRPVLLPLCILSAMIGGALWGIIPGLLKARFNVHEVVSTIMMNYISLWTVYYGIQTFFKDPMLQTESRRIPAAASLREEWLSQLFNGSYINLGLLLAIIAVIAVAIILNRTVLGYELKAVGFNRHAAEYAGIRVERNMVVSMAIAGSLAGLAGAALYIGNATKIEINILPSQGYDGIAVALIGANSPVGALLIGGFFGLLHAGKGFMSSGINIPPQIGETIIATILYFAATSVLIRRWTTALGRTRFADMVRRGTVWIWGRPATLWKRMTKPENFRSDSVPEEKTKDPGVQTKEPPHVDID